MKIIYVSIIFITLMGSLNAMTYLTLMNEQDLPITGAPLSYCEIYVTECDDYAHFHPIQCKRCKYCLEQEKEKFKIFSQENDFQYSQ